MSGIIGTASEARKPSEQIVLVAPYVDTIEMSSPRYFHSDLLKLVRVNSGSMLIKLVKDRENPEIIRRWLLKVNQPSRLCQQLLQRYKAHDPKLSDLTGLFWTKLCEKVSLERSFGHAEEEVQCGADRGAATPD